MLEELYLISGSSKDFNVFVQELLDEVIDYFLYKKEEAIDSKAFGYESDGREMTKEQEARQELKDNGFTIVKDYSSR